MSDDHGVSHSSSLNTPASTALHLPVRAAPALPRNRAAASLAAVLSAHAPSAGPLPPNAVQGAPAPLGLLAVVHPCLSPLGVPGLGRTTLITSPSFAAYSESYPDDARALANVHGIRDNFRVAQHNLAQVLACPDHSNQLIAPSWT